MISQAPSRERIVEWHEIRYLDPVPSRRVTALAVGLALLIMAVDLSLRSSYSVLYVAVLLILARPSHMRWLWWTAAALVVMTVSVSFIKPWINPAPVKTHVLGPRFVNRLMIGLMILWMTAMLKLWTRWHEEQSDEELPDMVRHQEQDISSTFAIMCCAPLILLIFAIDLIVPANFNPAVLYAIPLFICGWTRNRFLLWNMLGVLLSLSVAAMTFGPPSTIPQVEIGLLRTRIITGAGLFVVTIAVHFWMNRKAEPARAA